MNISLVKWHVIVSILLVWAGLLAGIPTSSQAGDSAPVVITGRLEVMIIEGPDHAAVTMDYFLQADNELIYQLQFSADPPEGSTTGQRVTATGYVEGSTLHVDPDGVTLYDSTEGNNLAADLVQGMSAPAPAVSVDERRTVVLMVDLLDAKASTRYTLQQIIDAMYTGDRSVDKLYRAASLDQLHFVADSDNDGAPDVFGPFTVNDYAGQSCDYVAWAQAAEAAATAAGIDLSLYRHRVFVLPRYNDLPRCSWSGIANVGCGDFCRTWIAEAESAMIYAHELGHNLNLAHAGTDPENDGIINNAYGDASDPMGSSRAWHLFNAPHVDQMEWYAPYPGSIVTVTQSGMYDIDVLDAGPIEVPPLTPRILKLPKPNGQGYYYLSYRQPVGYDDSLASTYTQRVNIHWYQGSGYADTAFVRSLTDGAAFTDNSSGGIIQVTQVSHSNDHVTVNISLCLGVPPTVTLLPSNQAVKPSGVSSYTVAVTNQDSAECPATTFTLGYLGSPVGTLTPAFLTLGGGASGLATLQVTAYPGLPSGVYPIVVQTNDTDTVPPIHSNGVNTSATLIVDGFPPTAPTNLQSTVDGQDRITLTWNPASDTLSGLQGYIVYRDNVEIGRTPGLSYLDTNPPVGTHTYVVAALDRAGNVSFSDSSLIADFPLPPTVIITAPADGATLTTDRSITFSGTATDAKGGSLTANLSWTSNLDGAIGSGGAFTRTLSAGLHILTAQVADSNGSIGMAALTVNVIQPTTLTFNSVGAEDGWVLESTANSGVGGSLKSSDTSNKALLLGDSSKKQQYKSILSFDTSALPDNATITSATLQVQRGTLSGTSPFTSYSPLLADVVSGGFNGNAALEKADFEAPATAVGVTSLSNATLNGAWSEGKLSTAGVTALNKTGRTQFRLYFNVKNNNDGVTDYLGYYAGEYGTAASRPQLVVNYVTNTAPVVTIGAPANNTQVAPGTAITFSGTASDTEDGNLSARLVWTSSRDGVIGRGGSFTKSTLSVGIHTITATVSDGFGAQATASITLINSSNHFPTVTLNLPSNGASFITGDVITFTGAASDPEDGNLTANLSWTSSIDGVIGNGGSFSRTLSVGTHTIQAQATDSGGFSGKATLTVTVANPTTVTFTSVGGEDGWVLESTETSNVGGSIKASDTSNKGLLLGDNRNNYQYKSILSFDTSSIPDNATILSVTLRLQRGALSGASPFDTHGALLADVVSGGFNGNSALETADFQAPATAVGVVALGNAASNGAWSEGALDANGLAALNKIGRTQFRLYFSLDDNNDKGDDYLGYYAGEYGTAASRPQLVVTYR